MPILCIALVVIVNVYSSVLMSHPISIIDAKIQVSKKQISADFSIYPEDFMFYQGIIPNDQGYLSKKKLMKAMKKHKSFLLSYFHLHNQNGEKLTGRVERIDHPFVYSRGLHFGDLMKKIVTYHIKYDLKEPVQSITLFQIFGGRSRFPALMDLQVSQENYPALDPVRLSNGGNRETFVFDWRKAKNLRSNVQRGPYLANIHKPISKLKKHGNEFLFQVDFPLQFLDKLFLCKRKSNERLTRDEFTTCVENYAKLIDKKIGVFPDGAIKSKFENSEFEILGPEKIVSKDLKQFSAYSAIIRLSRNLGIPKKEIKLSWGLFSESLYDLPLYNEVNKRKLFFTRQKPNIEIDLRSKAQKNLADG